MIDYRAKVREMGESPGVEEKSGREVKSQKAKVKKGREFKIQS